ncbi:MAG: ABC transporter permease [Mesorhizobium sp.]
MGFGPEGWGGVMLSALAVTVAVAASGFAIGMVVGILAAAARLSRFRLLNVVAEAYSTVFRGVPDLLVIYLFYFGGSSLITAVAQAMAVEGFVGGPTFALGAGAIGMVSGAYQMQVFRGAYQALPKGEIEAGRAIGMRPFVVFRRIIAPQAARYAIQGLGNVWQLALKESALISVVGLVELMRQAYIGASSTRLPFTFYVAAGILYLAVTFVSGLLFRYAEKRAMRGVRSALQS